ncbi:hypothetical protein BCU69_19185 [Vibrio cyclitrophicus]|uniref:glycosyltransferase n=1 Tax=Vibrio cyclitrophicus TaxID=47951 RepID=UPI000C862C27|nr:glycosyltransferase [Vibrio cyclitrophicus]PMH39149.1 hypothetical protein BCU69_19185 [Vibrio cyclitrophicus]
MINKYAPICLFVYNRPEHTKKTIDALVRNTKALDSDLYIFSDAAKNIGAIDDVEKVREIIHDISGFNAISIIESEFNKGLANSIIDGVSDVISKYGKVIVLEDDLILSPLTLEYLNIMLCEYKEEEHVFSVTSYNYPDKTVKVPDNFEYENYFTGRPCSWGWATWEDRWDLVKWKGAPYTDFLNHKSIQKQFAEYSGNDISRMLKKQLEGKIDSWAVRFTYNCFLLGKVASYPVKSYITNIGADGSGTHKGLNEDYVFNEELHCKLPHNINRDFTVQKDILKSFNEFVKRKYYFRRLVLMLKSIIKNLS